MLGINEKRELITVLLLVRYVSVCAAYSPVS